MKPVRIQLSRRKGFNLQRRSREINGLDAVVVTRPGDYGNPFVIGEDPPAWTRISNPVSLARLCPGKVETAEQAVALFRLVLLDSLLKYDATVDNLLKLRGKNLACWCKPGEPCHADVLLELANR